MALWLNHCVNYNCLQQSFRLCLALPWIAYCTFLKLLCGNCCSVPMVECNLYSVSTRSSNEAREKKKRKKRWCFGPNRLLRTMKPPEVSAVLEIVPLVTQLLSLFLPRRTGREGWTFITIALIGKLLIKRTCISDLHRHRHLISQWKATACLAVLKGQNHNCEERALEVLHNGLMIFWN